MTKRGKRIGRPWKAPTKKRVQIGVIVRAEIKRRINNAAKQSGRTVSQETEMLIERGLLVDKTLAAVREGKIA